MEEDQLIVGSSPNIHFSEGTSERDRLLDGRQGIFRFVPAGAAMADAKNPLVGTFFCHGSVLPYRGG